VEDVTQYRFPWAVPETRDPHEVVLDPETAEIVIALMTRAVIAVVRAVEEVDDER
jgi:hypothetical protein